VREKKLQIDSIKAKMAEKGISNSDIAHKIDVSRTIVSNWLNGEKFPRPKMLLELGRVLELKYNDLVTRKEDLEPVIAFRKKAGVKTTDTHIKLANDMAYALEELLPFVEFDIDSKPATLIKPQNDYEYIQRVAESERFKINIVNDEIRFDEIIKLFKQYHATIIPVLWGNKNNHENAMHIYLPESMSTWIYFNLDVNLFDFKFWMAHELGHVKAPELHGNIAEDFADNFAGAFLFSKEMSENNYKDLRNLKNDTGILVNRLKDIANKYLISPYTILREVNKYAHYIGEETLDINIGGAVSNFNKEKDLVSEIILKNKTNIGAYIDSTEEIFGTRIFKMIRKYLLNNTTDSKYIQRVLKMNIYDAKSIYSYLLQ
jgi:transcriptional regulator with XRE-family HTH domain